MNPNVELHTRYPLWSVILYNGSTILHILLGAAGIVIGFGFSPLSAWVGGLLYLTLAFVELYLLMPSTVCPSCVYYNLENSLCISGLNLVSRKFSKKRDPADFPKRSEGILCCNNFYMAALLFPILPIVFTLIVNFSVRLLIVFVFLIASLLFRLFVIIPKVGCVHCLAKDDCPKAGATGVREF
jgi:hypothetical protein